MKLKIGDKVNFDFLSEPLVGVIEEIRPLSHGIDQEDRYFINDGKHLYPIKKVNIQGKI
tara:strand:- start:102 stop:278 length:177 start_codon:yes stop_codon:yes gene_type:complete